MPASLWSGNLRLSLVIIPVKMHSAVSTEDAISFRMSHEPTGNPIRDVKGVIDVDEFTEVPEEEIVKGYEHAKGQHVLIRPSDLDDKLEAKHTIDMVRFVDEAEIDSRSSSRPPITEVRTKQEHPSEGTDPELAGWLAQRGARKEC